MDEDLTCECCLQTGHPKWPGGIPGEILCNDAEECLDRAIANRL